MLVQPVALRSRKSAVADGWPSERQPCLCRGRCLCPEPGQDSCSFWLAGHAMFFAATPHGGVDGTVGEKVGPIVSALTLNSSTMTVPTTRATLVICRLYSRDT